MEGDYANGKDSGIIELVLVGSELNIHYIQQLSLKIEKEIKRKVHFTTVEDYEGKGLVLFEE